MILVTGGCGFIGSNLAAYFSAKDDEVTVMDSLTRKGSEKNLDWLKRTGRGIKFVKGNIRDLSTLEKAVKDVDVIFHTAAQVAVTASVNNPRDDFESNALGTFNVVEAARRSGGDPIIFYTSTNKVYGNGVNLIPIIEKEKRYEFAGRNFAGVPETFPTDSNEHTPYGCSKYAADLYVRDYAAVYGMKTLVFRNSCIYGPRQFGNEDQGWVAHFIISAILGRRLVIYGNGKQVRDILFITDLIDAFVKAIENIRKTKGNVYNMGGGPENTISLLEFIELLGEIRGQNLITSYEPWRPFDQKIYVSDITRARKDFGWEPRVSYKQGIKQLFEWAHSNVESLR